MGIIAETPIPTGRSLRALRVTAALGVILIASVAVLAQGTQEPQRSAAGRLADVQPRPGRHALFAPHPNHPAQRQLPA